MLQSKVSQSVATIDLADLELPPLLLFHCAHCWHLYYRKHGFGMSPSRHSLCSDPIANSFFHNQRQPQL